MDTNQSEENLDCITQLIKVIICPLIFIIMFIAYSSDAGRLISVLINKLEDANNVTIGALKLKLISKHQIKVCLN